MKMTEDEYLQHREHCLLMAEVAPTEPIRAWLLRVAGLCEVEARLIKHSVLRLLESRAVIARVNALLGVAKDSAIDAAGSLPAAPYPATSGQVPDTSFAARHR